MSETFCDSGAAAARLTAVWNSYLVDKFFLVDLLEIARACVILVFGQKPRKSIGETRPLAPRLCALQDDVLAMRTAAHLPHPAGSIGVAARWLDGIVR